jgi:hypothetical protein
MALFLSKNTVLFMLNTTFRRLDSVSVFRYVKPTQIGPIDTASQERTMDNVQKHNTGCGISQLTENALQSIVALMVFTK